mgnify:FL=1
MKHKRIDGPKPLPRLQHIEPGQFFTLKNGAKYQLLDKDRLYGYVQTGKIGLSCELDPTGMVFGDGGWRVK